MVRKGNGWLLWFSIMLFVLGLTGCAGITGLESPKVTLADLKVQQVTALESSFLIQLRVANPNSAALEVTGLACDLELDNEHFASGMQGETQSVPAYSTALVPVEVHASMLHMVSSVLQWIQASQREGGGAHDGIQYGLKGHVRVKSGGMSYKLPFESAGELRLGTQSGK